jgi:hypothetical protein
MKQIFQNFITLKQQDLQQIGQHLKVCTDGP